MAVIQSWSTTAASNSSAAPDGFPENMSSAGFNDGMREVMAQLKTWYNAPEWLDLNYGKTITRVGATSFKVVSMDATTWFTANRRVKIVGATTDYGFVESSSYAAGDTTVNVTMDSADVPTTPTLALVHHSATLSRVAFVGGVPTGAMFPFSGAVANIPSGYLLCDGAEVSKTTYAALWTAFGGHLYGTASSPSTHFLLPNMGGKVSIGYVAGGDGDGDYGTVGGTYGSKKHTLTSAEMPTHSHSVTDPGHVHAGVSLTAGGTVAGGSGFTQTATNTASNTTGITIQNAGSGDPHENRQPSIVGAWIVKT